MYKILDVGIHVFYKHAKLQLKIVYILGRAKITNIEILSSERCKF
jgi:hypothetical protein